MLLLCTEVLQLFPYYSLYITLPLRVCLCLCVFLFVCIQSDCLLLLCIKLQYHSFFPIVFIMEHETSIGIWLEQMTFIITQDILIMELINEYQGALGNIADRAPRRGWYEPGHGAVEDEKDKMTSHVQQWLMCNF